MTRDQGAWLAPRQDASGGELTAAALHRPGHDRQLLWMERGSAACGSISSTRTQGRQQRAQQGQDCSPKIAVDQP